MGRFIAAGIGRVSTKTGRTQLTLSYSGELSKFDLEFYSDLEAADLRYSAHRRF